MLTVRSSSLTASAPCVSTYAAIRRSSGEST
jgi:hypothetical protein